ncbi:MAG: hypothetical protein [Bacteriophage sp.]|uniref:Putative golgin subfamily A member 2-like protein 5 n=1 Tax=Podoviridae sp. ctn7K25 TaxID=2825273 RepID=A0A8S5QD20_9CAUD|nr:MAG: hypothetical protein [Bacteriophage sp.]DAE16697.1 MAG TPA: putative golgin subfamily A member 2-like protein 5 [Podoviridae sp. ctn7K25]
MLNTNPHFPFFYTVNGTLHMLPPKYKYQHHKYIKHEYKQRTI